MAKLKQSLFYLCPHSLKLNNTKLIEMIENALII